VVPTVLGFDARLQFVHEDDGLEAVRLAAVHDRPGIYNIAGDGVIALSQATRRASALPAPVPSVGASAVGALFRRARLADFSPEQVRFLTYGRAVDTSRARARLRFDPVYTTEQAFEAFLAARRPQVGTAHAWAAAMERALVGSITRGRVDVAG
jgi:UDP-glucose 4-epimerase